MKYLTVLFLHFINLPMTSCFLWPSKKQQDCELSDWGKWSSCSKSCGMGGIRERKRTKIREPSNGGKECGLLFDEENCPSPSHCCPKDCTYGDWGQWSQCQGCGRNGIQRASRKVLAKEKCGGKCDKGIVKTRQCRNA